jgi:AraC family transcriptional regulator
VDVGIKASGVSQTAETLRRMNISCLPGVAGEMLSHTGLDYIQAPRFETYVLCTQLRPTRAAMWVDGRSLAAREVRRGFWQAHCPGQSFEAEVESGYEMLRISLSTTAVETIAHDLGVRHGSVESVFARMSGFDPLLTSLSEQIAENLRDDRALDLYNEHLIMVIANYSVGRARKVDRGSGERAKGGLAPWRVRLVQDYLLTNIAGTVTLDDLSQVSGLSPYHLCRAFAQTCGLPPHRWLHEQRMTKACALLEGSALPVTEIAARVGYDNPGHFSQAFRRKVGVSPIKYRRDRTD